MPGHSTFQRSSRRSDLPSFGFNGPSAYGRNISPDGERAINLYPELISGIGASRGTKYNYYGRPGLTLFSSIASPVRALWGGNNRLFAIGGSTLYEISSGGAASVTGSLGSYAGPKHGQIVSNGQALFVYDGDPLPSAPNCYIADGITVTAVITGVAITYLDGYFVALRPGGPDFSMDPIPVNTLNQTQFNLSALLYAPVDGVTFWDPLQFAIKTGAPDAIVQILGAGSPGGGYEELWLFGKKTTEVWQNTGGTALNPFPLQRVPGAFINQGCWARDSILALDNSIFFLGGDDRGVGVVWRMNGYIPQKISTHEVEYWLQQASVAGIDISDAIAWAAQHEGHQFYVLNFPTADKTWVYDVTEKLWHEWASGSSIGSLHAFKGWSHAWTFGRHFVGDGSSGNIYTLKPSAYQDNGSSILWNRTAPHLCAEKKWQIHRSLELHQGGPFTQDRTFSLEVSNDGGFTFGAPVAATVGPTGESADRVRWRRLGRARDRVYRISSTDNLPQTWVDAYVEVIEGAGG